MPRDTVKCYDCNKEYWRDRGDYRSACRYCGSVNTTIEKAVGSPVDPEAARRTRNLVIAALSR